jgi:SAM-dependent methyltransferase
MRHALRTRLRRTLGVDALQARIDQLEERVLESKEETWERSRRRWRDAEPESALTWGRGLSGDPFISKLSQHVDFTPETRVLEIGPGYGRLLRALLGAGLPFQRYTGLDISSQNVEYLKREFPDARINLLVGDVETFSLETKVDVVYSSLTFKHFYPSMASAVRNLSGQMEGSGTLAFDLIEGSTAYFEDDNVTYIKQYTRPEVEEILTGAALELVTFDEVEHAPDRRRLLVVARKP